MSSPFFEMTVITVFKESSINPYSQNVLFKNFAIVLLQNRAKSVFFDLFLSEERTRLFPFY